MARRLIVPAHVQTAARLALGSKPSDVPEVAYRLAAGECTVLDRTEIAMFALDHPDAYQGTKRCTVDAALRGGHAGKTWAMASLTMGVDIEQVLNDLSRSDQHLTPALAAAIGLAWRRTIDAAVAKANSRLAKSTEGRQVSFTGFPHRQAARIAGVDDLLYKAWESFKVSVVAILDDYAHTTVTILRQIDEPAAQEVGRQIRDRAHVATLALVAFMDERARSYITGDAPYAPQDFLAARAITAWVSGALPAPDGFTYVDLAALGALTATALSTAEMAAVTFADVSVVRDLTWQHGFYGEPMAPFAPHIEADERTFTEGDVSKLGIWPGDHVGCRCELVPTWRVA